MTEKNKYEIIKKLVDTNGNKKRAALKLSCSTRHINRMIQGYILQGKEFFIHSNKGRQPNHAISPDVKQNIIDLYRTKYWDANFTHFSELLLLNENLSVSPSTLRAILAQEFILSPKARHITKKKVRTQLEELKKNTSSKKELTKITESIIAIEDAHPRRPRCAFFGEMLQMDASVHHWFGAEKAQLHIAVDDCTGVIVGAHFDHQETLKGYYHVFHQILIDYGIPYMFFTDRRTVFEYKQKKAPSIEEDTFTQFGYACKQLGVAIETSSVPQAKGRVERMFQTLQSRLPLELRLAGATTLEQANIFLNSYIKKYNAKFALPIDHSKSVFETQPEDEKINLILAVLTPRKVDNGHSIRFNKEYYKLLDCSGHPVYYHKGTSCMVVKAFNGNLFACVGETVYSLEVIPQHEHTSRNFDLPKTVAPTRKQYIPSMNHPWRQASFEKFLKNQTHRSKETA